jgi:hypothetical protein
MKAVEGCFRLIWFHKIWLIIVGELAAGNLLTADKLARVEPSTGYLESSDGMGAHGALCNNSITTTNSNIRLSGTTSHMQILVTYMQVLGILKSVTFRIPEVTNRLLTALGIVSGEMGTGVSGGKRVHTHQCLL